MRAAVYHRPHELVPIEEVDVDKPWGREVLVRTVATGVCHSDLHVVDGLGRFPLDRPIVLGHEGAGRRRGGRRRCDHGQARRPCRRLPVGFLRQLPAMPFGASESVHRRHRHAARERRAAAVAERPAVAASSSASRSYAEKMLLHENSLVRIDPELPLDRAALVGCGVLTGRRRGVAQLGLEAGRPSRCSAAAASGCRSSRARGSAARGRSSPSTSSTRSARWRCASARRISSTSTRTTRSRRCAH